MPETNILTTWRQALTAHLIANLPSPAWDVRGGELDAPDLKKKGETFVTARIACVFVPKIRTAPNILFANPPMTIRAWPGRSKMPKPQVPLDPAPLEQLAVDLMTILEPVQTTLVTGLYFWVAEVDIDEDDWGVRATLTSYMLNPAVSGA